MHSTIEVKASATKLREALHALGHQLKHSQCLEAISKIEGYPDWNTHSADINNNQRIAEQFLDEMIGAENELNRAKFTQRFEQKYLVAFTEHVFLKDMRDIREELGSYIRREFMGSVSGKKYNDDDRYPNHVRYTWRGYFDKCEVLIVVGIYQVDGKHYVSGFRYR